MTEQTLEEYLEAIVFDKNKLKSLKEQLTQLLQKKHNDVQKELLTAFLEYLAHVFDNLLGNIPFYFENVIAKQEITAFSNTPPAQVDEGRYNSLRAEMKEKDEFLEQMAQRIQRIYSRLTLKK